MNVLKNARLTLRSREILISRLQRNEHPADVACAMGVSTSTVYKWWRLYRTEGLEALQDRSSRPRNSPARTVQACEELVVDLRR